MCCCWTIWPIAEGLSGVGAGRWVKLGTGGANEFAHVCCWECRGCHTSNAVELIPRPIRIGLERRPGKSVQEPET